MVPKGDKAVHFLHSNDDEQKDVVWWEDVIVPFLLVVLLGVFLIKIFPLH